MFSQEAPWPPRAWTIRKVAAVIVGCPWLAPRAAYRRASLRLRRRSSLTLISYRPDGLRYARKSQTSRI